MQKALQTYISTRLVNLPSVAGNSPMKAFEAKTLKRVDDNVRDINTNIKRLVQGQWSGLKLKKSSLQFR